MRVRPATAADADALVALEAEALGADAWSPGLVAEGVRGALPTVHWLAAETEPADGSGAVLVGHAVVSLAGDVAELQRIGVAAAHRRRGLASLLLEHVQALAAEAGAARVLLEVREDNAAALGLYRARGFGDVGRRERYYRDGAAALVLERATWSVGGARDPSSPPRR